MLPVTPSLLRWATHEDALARAVESGALAEIEAALHTAYDLTATSERGRLHPSKVLEGALKGEGWRKVYVWAADGLQRFTGESFDGWKCFTDADGNRFGVAAEVEWNWERVYFDLLKFWRAARGGQATLGIEILRGPDSFDYAVHHQYALYRDLFPELRVVFCALDAADLREPDYERNRKVVRKRVWEMP